MGNCQKLSAALAVIALTATAVPAVAQPSDTPGDTTPPPGRSQQPVPKSDEHRIVGKVVHIDRDEGLMTPRVLELAPPQCPAISGSGVVIGEP